MAKEYFVYIDNLRRFLFLGIMMIFVLFVFVHCLKIALFLRLDLLIPFFKLSLLGLDHI